MRGLPALRSLEAELEGCLPSGCPVCWPPSFLTALLCLPPTPVLSTAIARETLGSGRRSWAGPQCAEGLGDLGKSAHRCPVHRGLYPQLSL